MLCVLSELFMGKIKVALLEVNNVPARVVFSSGEYLVSSVPAVRCAFRISSRGLSGRRGRAERDRADR
jgi:hypothetical protein